MNESQFRRGKQIHKQTGKTFYLATRLLPTRIREPTYVLYGFFRIADEIVDGSPGLSPAQQRERLERLRAAAHGEREADRQVVAAFSNLRREHDIPDEEVDVFLDAMLADIDTDQYETYEELRTYIRGSAASVGRMMTALMDPELPQEVLTQASALGEAFQLTNFLRDVREDIRDLDRVYIPRETLRQYDVTVSQIRDEEVTPGFRRAIRSELRRTEQRYRDGVAGIEHLPEDCQFAVVLAATLYAEHHRLIRQRNFDVLTGRPTLSMQRKLLVVARTWWNWRRFEDPVTVFRRVSPIPDVDVDIQVPSEQSPTPQME